MEEIRTYPEMNEKIKDILKIDSDPFYLYVAQRIDELEQEVEHWERRYKVLDKLLSETNEDEKMSSKTCWCKDCKWYEPFEGVCTNGESDNRADFVSAHMSCEHCERVEDANEGNK